MPDLDWTNDLGPADDELAEPRTEPYDPAKDRENVRGHIAYIVLALFGLLVLGALASAAWSSEPGWKQVSAGLGLLLSPVVALVGAVTGFYFGEKAGKP